MNPFSQLLRAGDGKRIRMLSNLVSLVNDMEPDMEALSDEELQVKTVEFQNRLANGETFEDILVEAFAVMREAAWRVLGQRHFDVQLMGGMALHFGWIAEMKTGEGKTLVSTLPVYLNALGGRGVHVVTSNDYLATRDSELMGRVHRWLGLSVGRVGPDITDPEAKRAAYACDITYGTNTELGFDYLRDNMSITRAGMVQRGHVFAIIDEVDSILIDEARTPLIITGGATQEAELYYQFATLSRMLIRDEDYEADEAKKVVFPLESGIAKIERAIGVENIYDELSSSYVHHLESALSAKELYVRNKDYLVEDGEVKIVDEFTGRTLEGRRWSDGLHQAIEAKERVPIQMANATIATVTVQNYFLMYEKLSGMTGTAETEASEFARTYNLTVLPIPTNRPPQRIDREDLIYKTEAEKFNAVADEVARRRESGQPVLVGTASVAKSEEISQHLAKRGIPHEVLNAKQHFREAEVIAQAGRLGAVTVATNMAGRGVDILLGGNPEGLAVRQMVEEGIDLTTDESNEVFAQLLEDFKMSCAKEGERVREVGGLYVLGSERHESRRIDNQLRGRSGRQGEPGESRFFLSLEDDLMRLFGSKALDKVVGFLPDNTPINDRVISKAVEKAQSTVEGRSADIRKDVFEYDEVMNAQRRAIYALRLDAIDAEDFHERTLELLGEILEACVLDCAPDEFPEEWDLDRLVVELDRYYPTAFTAADLAQAATQVQLIDSVVADATSYYEERRDSFGAELAATVECEVMLQVMDLRWRDHMKEMELLREGINLRSVASQSPLVAWKRDGYALFEKLIDVINDDYLRYVLRATTKVDRELVNDGTMSLSGPSDAEPDLATLAD